MTKGVDTIRRSEIRWGLIFISPWIAGFLLFYAIPLVSSLGFSFFEFNLIETESRHFIGLANWKRALFEDHEVLATVGRILTYSLIALPISFLFSLFAALLLNTPLLPAKRTFRSLFYLPTMIPMVASVLIWNGVLNEQTGWINYAIRAITGIDVVGVEGLRWLADAKLIYLSYAFIGLWGVGNTMMILLAGLQGVPTELYEAATVDGARALRRLFSITLPMITPVIFYNLIVAVIGLMQFFLVPWVINQGNGYPDGMTNFPMGYFYRQSFSYFNMGYGSVLAWVIFLIGMFFALVLFGTSKRWVYYAGGQE